MLCGIAASPAWYNVANVVVSHRIDFDPTTASPSATRVQLNRNFFLDLHTARDRLTFLYYFFLFHVPTSMYFGIQLVVTLATIMATGNDMHVVDFVEDRGTNPYVAALLISMVVIVVLLTGALGVWKNDVVLQTTVVVALLSMLENKSQSPALRLGILIAAGALAFCTLVVGTNMIRATQRGEGSASPRYARYGPLARLPGQQQQAPPSHGHAVPDDDGRCHHENRTTLQVRQPSQQQAAAISIVATAMTTTTRCLCLFSFLQREGKCKSASYATCLDRRPLDARPPEGRPEGEEAEVEVELEVELEVEVEVEVEVGWMMRPDPSALLPLAMLTETGLGLSLTSASTSTSPKSPNRSSSLVSNASTTRAIFLSVI
eukprot:CAMPEP_0170755014 /NCGR_PEP_ID=MMETSP0437-20130122/13298_1 /TAXON_ID=0 /ORGANISM="Sexangularia sp." /LENGTH=374 /DNA_ID=CAMNT_0011094167 /DNA_START=456 /DNA_END=1584 /DNA_ORIENTATION=+